VNTVHNKRLNKQSVMQTDAGDSQHSLNWNSFFTIE
jgi:hypothetical protein